MEKQQHKWNFSSVGGVKRVNIESGADLLSLDTLDQKLWTALSCSTIGLEIDAKTLELIDTDKDGRIRVPEILAAVKWATSLITNADDLLKEATELPLASINQQSEEGKRLYASAQAILKAIGKTEQATLSVEETTASTSIFASTQFNGDGIITPESTDDSILKELILNCITYIGSLQDRSGKPGISEVELTAFIEQAQNYSDWWAQCEVNPAIILPFGDNTAACYESYKAVELKINDYFLRCRLTQFDESARERINTLPAYYEQIGSKNLALAINEIEECPLVKITHRQTLALTDGINPAWSQRLEQFVQTVVHPLFPGIQELTLQQWEQVQLKFQPYKQWQEEKKGGNVAPLGLPYLRSVLQSAIHEQVIELIEKDKALAQEVLDILSVEKLVRYYRDLYTLLKNFVTFYDFYSPKGKAIFQCGSLYIDQRSCDLCLKVTDMSKHTSMVGLSGMYLIYCDCVSKSRNEKMTILAAMTNGDIDNLVVGRNAVFYDRKGNDWDATVIKIVENPISIRQAFWSPYRKVGRFIETQIDKVATAQEKEVHAANTGAVEQIIPTKIDPTPKPAPVPFDISKFVGIFAAIGLAMGAIGGVLASFISGFLKLAWWKMPFAIAGIILAISGPSMIIAYFKLRKRNLAPILDANGWAINARAIINIAFGNTLTHLVQLPGGAVLNLNDPFTQKKNPVNVGLVILLAVFVLVITLLWKTGYLKRL